MKMIKRLSLLIILWIGLATLLPRPVTAQTELTIQQLRIQLMPEFDDPRLLVIIQGRLNAPAESFPRPVTFLIPRASQINQMATMNVVTGETTPQDYDLVPSILDARWTEVTYTLDSAHFFYEYYTDGPAGDTNKQFNWTFNTPLAVDDLLVEIQQPLKATDFALAPPAPTTRSENQFGFTYHQFPLGSWPANEDWAVQVNYHKSDPAPSISRDQLSGTGQPITTNQAATTAPAGTTTAPPITTITGLVAGAVGLAIIARMVWFRRRSPPTLLQPLVTSEVVSTLFCPHCGVTLKENAKFCHSCGSARS